MAEKRAKEPGDSPAKRLEITAAMCFNFALVRLAPCCSSGTARAPPPSSSLPSEKFVSKLYHRKQLKFARMQGTAAKKTVEHCKWPLLGKEEECSCQFAVKYKTDSKSKQGSRC